MRWRAQHRSAPTATSPRKTTALARHTRAAVATLPGLLIAATVALAPSANAMPYGNYTMNIPDRNDFHTWIWMISPCGGDCVLVNSFAQPVARAYTVKAQQARLANGSYSLVVDDPFGLRCDNIYYGPTIPTHDVYSWDANTLAGSMQSSFDSGCNGAPGGALTYPITLTRL